MKAIIIDDEKMARTLLNGYVQEFCADVEVVEMCADLPSGVKAIRKHQPDIVFLDIEMPGHSGLELLDFFDEKEANFSIIFITAYNQYAIQAFKLSAVDYLLKPVEPSELAQAVNRCRQQKEKSDFQLLKENLTPQSKRKIAIAMSNSIKYVALDSIMFLKADGAYTEIILSDDSKLIASRGLKHFDETLSDVPSFFRCHKSYLINTEFITDYVKSDGGFLKIKHHEIGISTEKVDAFLNHMKNL